MPDEPTPPEDENEAVAVTGRPNDLVIREHEPALANSTWASRAAARPRTKAVQSAENKSVPSATKKRGA